MDFKDYLLAEGFSQATANTYYKAVAFLLSDQSILDVKKLNIGSVVSKLKAMRYKNQYSKYKNAFLKLCEYINIPLNSYVLAELQSINIGKIKKRRKMKAVKLQDIENHIRIIRDSKLKLSYQVMLSTGLRLFELCQVTPCDCVITQNAINIHFIGKGGKPETVAVTDPQIMKKLTVLISSTDTNKKVFYSANYLQNKAKAMGFQCIDLRRAFAKVTYGNSKSLSHVMEQMRHTQIKSTKIYLNSKVKI